MYASQSLHVHTSLHSVDIGRRDFSFPKSTHTWNRDRDSCLLHFLGGKNTCAGMEQDSSALCLWVLPVPFPTMYVCMQTCRHSTMPVLDIFFLSFCFVLPCPLRQGGAGQGLHWRFAAFFHFACACVVSSPSIPFPMYVLHIKKRILYCLVVGSVKKHLAITWGDSWHALNCHALTFNRRTCFQCIFVPR